jgi:coenzyme F420 biosynthesis associated uncharacterized protein
LTGSLLDWALAARIGSSVAGEGEAADWAGPEPVALEAARAAALVVDYTALDPGDTIPDARSVDRASWVRANLQTLRGAVELLEPRLAESLELPDPLGAWLRALAGRFASAQAGLVVGYAGRRVLGQYELPIVGPPREPRLLFVAPNLTAAGRELDSEAPLLRWIALHEMTHAVNFGAVGWLRGHLSGLIEELITTVEVSTDASRLLEAAKSVLATDPRRLIAELRDVDPVTALAGPEQRRLIDLIQAAMTVVEGYAEHVMDAVGSRLDPDVARLRDGLEKRRRARSPLEALLSRLLGFELKLRQYREGRRFANRVVELAGIEGLNRAWVEPAALPDGAEIADPEAWLRRVS